MFRPALGLIGILTVLLVAYSSHGQQAEAPVYQDGDWWRIKVDVVRPTDVSVSGPVLERFPEYIVKFESNNPKVFGVQGNESKEVNPQVVTSLVLGRPAWLGEMLRFPLRVGLTWSDRLKFQPPGAQMRWEEAKYEVQAWEKTRTPRGEFDAFKIVMTMNVPEAVKSRGRTELRTHTYYYATDVKAIANLHTSGSARVESTLVDFNLAK
jgi:hypothetical protein